jgi:hypothetical protein
MSDMLKFRSQIGSGLIRPNQFKVTLQFPKFITGGKNLSKSAQFLCRATSLPASTVAPIPVYHRGRPINVAGEREFQPWSVAIYNEDFKLRNALLTWSHAINNIHNNTGLIRPADYKMIAIVEQLDRNDDIPKVVTLEGAFPVDISAIELDWENNAQVELFQCTFVYDWFYESDVSSKDIKIIG